VFDEWTTLEDLESSVKDANWLVLTPNGTLQAWYSQDDESSFHLMGEPIHD